MSLNKVKDIWNNFNANSFSNYLSRAASNSPLVQIARSPFGNCAKELYSFVSLETMVSTMFQYMHVFFIYLFALCLLLIKRTDVIGLTIIVFMNCFLFFILTTSLTSQSCIAEWIYVFFPLLTLSACSGLIIYIIAILKHKYASKSLEMVFINDDVKVYQLVKKITAVTTMLTLLLVAMYKFYRTNDGMKVFMMFLLAALVGLYISLLYYGVVLFRKTKEKNNNLYVPKEVSNPYNQIQLFGKTSIIGQFSPTNIARMFNVNYLLHGFNTEI